MTATTTALKSKENIIVGFEAYIAKHGGRFGDWYVGVAANPQVRLFQDHNVNESADAWIYQDAGNDEVARSVEKYFLEIRLTQGGSGGGDSSTRFVYAYKTGPHTGE